MSNGAYSRQAKIFLSLLNLIAFIATVAVNALATILPINNKTTGQLSDQYPNLFVPAGITFSIWGIIYLLLGIYIIYQLVIAFSKRSGGVGILEKIGILFFLSSLFNIGWIFAWHYEILWLSLIFMVLLFIMLLSIYLRLRIGKSDAGGAEKGLAHLAFSVYMGWITIATIANVTALLVDIGWNGFNLSEQFWAVLVIAVGIIIALLVIFTRNDMFYCLVVVWSLLGILLKRLSDASTPALGIIITVITGMALIVLGIIIQLARKKRVYW